MRRVDDKAGKGVTKARGARDASARREEGQQREQGGNSEHGNMEQVTQAMERGARVGRELSLTLLSQMAIELGSQWNRTWKSGFSLTNRTRSAASGVHEA